jgi:hypothetical protein
MKQAIYLIFAVLTAMIGYHIHHSVGYAVVNFLFAPISWIYWLVTGNINMTIIKDTFSFFFK